MIGSNIKSTSKKSYQIIWLKCNVGFRLIIVVGELSLYLQPMINWTGEHSNHRSSMPIVRLLQILYGNQSSKGDSIGRTMENRNTGTENRQLQKKWFL
jgi:hypothetical protein